MVKRRIPAVIVLAIFAICLPLHSIFASKGDLAVREDYDAFHKDYDQPFRTTAIISGWCKDSSIPLSDSRQIMDLYQIGAEDAEGVDLNKVGILYFDDRGREAVCVDERAIHPFIIKNVRGEVVTILGWVTSGAIYGLGDDKIVIVESMEYLGDE